MARFELNGNIYESNEKGNYFYKSTGLNDKNGNPILKRVSRAIYEQAFDEYTKNAADEADAWEAEVVEPKAEAEKKQAKADKETEDNFNKKHGGVEIPQNALEANKRYVEKQKKAKKPVIDFDSVFDGDTTSYFLYVDGERVQSFWSHEEMMKVAREEYGYETEEDKAQKRAQKKAKSAAYVLEENGQIYATLTDKQVDFLREMTKTNFYENGTESTLWCDCLVDEIGGQFAGKAMTVGAMISTLREKELIHVGVDKVNGKKAKFFELTWLGKKVVKELV